MSIMDHTYHTNYFEGRLPMLKKLSDLQPTFLPQETLRLDGKNIVSTSAPSTTLYTLQHNILDTKSARAGTIMLRRRDWSLPLGIDLYNLSYAAPGGASKSECCCLVAKDELGMTPGNIALQRLPRSMSGKGKVKLLAQLSPKPLWYHDVKSVEYPDPVLVMGGTADGYECYAANSNPWPIARERVTENGEKQLVILKMMDQLHRDTLVALWCLGLWRRMVRAQSRVRASRLEREKRLIKGRTARAESCMEELIRRYKLKQVMIEAGIPEHLAEDPYADVR